MSNNQSYLFLPFFSRASSFFFIFQHVKEHDSCLVKIPLLCIYNWSHAWLPPCINRLPHKYYYMYTCLVKKNLNNYAQILQQNNQIVYQNRQPDFINVDRFNSCAMYLLRELSRLAHQILWHYGNRCLACCVIHTHIHTFQSMCYPSLLNVALVSFA